MAKTFFEELGGKYERQEDYLIAYLLCRSSVHSRLGQSAALIRSTRERLLV